MNILFDLETEDDTPISYKELFDISAYHRIPYILIYHSEDGKYLELSENTACPSDIFFLFNENDIDELEDVLSGSGHCFIHKLVDGVYK